MERHKNRNVVVVLAAAALLLVGGAWYGTYPTPTWDAETQNAIAAGYDVAPYLELSRLQIKVDSTAKLSPAEWQRLKAIYSDTSINRRTRRYALGTMMGLGRTPYRNEILALVRPQLKNPEWTMQNGALILLRHFHTSDWQTEAAKRLNSPDENIRSNAQVQFQLGV